MACVPFPDSSVEGIISTPESGKQVWGCQFHPESAGGPLDTIEMFSDFLAACKANRDGKDSSSKVLSALEGEADVLKDVQHEISAAA